MVGKQAMVEVPARPEKAERSFVLAGECTQAAQAISKMSFSAPAISKQRGRHQVSVRKGSCLLQRRVLEAEEVALAHSSCYFRAAGQVNSFCCHM